MFCKKMELICGSVNFTDIFKPILTVKNSAELNEYFLALGKRCQNKGAEIGHYLGLLRVFLDLCVLRGTIVEDDQIYNFFQKIINPLVDMFYRAFEAPISTGKILPELSKYLSKGNRSKEEATEIIRFVVSLLGYPEKEIKRFLKSLSYDIKPEEVFSRTMPMPPKNYFEPR